MKNEALYNKTVDILVQAYFNDTLSYFECWKCAVGNMVAANLGVEPAIGKSNMWMYAVDIITYSIFDTPSLQGMKEIEATGYSPFEILAIEKAFQVAAEGDQFLGLMAVIDVLDQIHENTDEKVTAQSKQKFEKVL